MSTPQTTKEYLIAETKRLRRDLDALLQQVKDHKAYIADPQFREAHTADCLDLGEAIAQITISTREIESGIMRLGMTLKHIGAPNPYPESKNPDSTTVEPTADGIKL